VRAIESIEKEGSRLDLLQIIIMGNYDEDNSADNPGGAILTKLVNTKKLMIAASRDGGPAAFLRPETRHNTRFVLQPIREVLLQICCRYSGR
jgi:hypothetical protein